MSQTTRKRSAHNSPMEVARLRARCVLLTKVAMQARESLMVSELVQEMLRAERDGLRDGILKKLRMPTPAPGPRP